MTIDESIEQFKERITITDYKEQIPEYYEDMEMAIKALEEIQMYKDGKLCLIPADVYAKQCEELDAYKEIGTVEEVMELKEQNITLRNRCKIFTKGQLCIFCPIRCAERTEECRNVKGGGVDAGNI